MVAQSRLLLLLLALATAAASGTPAHVLSFAPCPASPTPASTWNYTGQPGGSGGPILWGGDALQCLQPLRCSQLAGAPVALAPCAATPPACTPWFYDTYTSFTLTSVQSSNRLTSAGAAGLNATVDAPTGDSTQQFVVNGGQISPASDTSLCLTST